MSYIGLAEGDYEYSDDRGYVRDRRYRKVVQAQYLYCPKSMS